MGVKTALSLSTILILKAHMPDNGVTVLSYYAFMVDWKLSRYVDDEPYKAKLLAIRDDQITNPMAAFPLRKGFEHRARLSKAVAFMQIALHVIYDDFGKQCFYRPLKNSEQVK